MKKLGILTLAFLLIFGFSACTGQNSAQNNDGKESEPQKTDQTNDVSENASNESSDKEDASEEISKIKLILDYVPNTNHTGFYVAKEKGFYKDAGLELEIEEPIDGVTSTLIANGKGDFGISYQEDVTYALSSEEPLPIKAIATIIQHNTSGFASAKSKNINSAKDFEGKVYAGWGSPAEEAIMKAVVEKAGGDFNKVQMVLADSADYTVLEKNADLIWLFWAWDGIAAKLAGVDINYLELKDLDSRLDYYTPIIIANTDTLDNKKEMTKKFMQATKKGYEYAIKNPEESAKILHKFIPESDENMLIESQKYLAEKYSEGTDNWGEMKAEVWDAYCDFLIEFNLLKEKVPAEKCFTNEFLK